MCVLNDWEKMKQLHYTNYNCMHYLQLKNMSLDYSFEIVNHNSAPIILTSKATMSIYV